MPAAMADFVVRSADQRPQLVVEAKTKHPASAAWAAQMRRNLVAHGAVPVAPYFLLALPDRFYLWKNASPTEAVPADFEADAADALGPYLQSLTSALADLNERSFELLIKTWLDDLVHSQVWPPQQSKVKAFLYQSGLLDSIQHGSVRSQETK